MATLHCSPHSLFLGKALNLEKLRARHVKIAASPVFAVRMTKSTCQACQSIVSSVVIECYRAVETESTHMQEIQEYVTKAFGSKASSDPFEVMGTDP